MHAYHSNRCRMITDSYGSLVEFVVSATRLPRRSVTVMCSFVSGGLLQCSTQAMLHPHEHRTSVTCALCCYNFALSAHTALLASMWTARCTARCRRWSCRVAAIRAWPIILLSFLFLSRWKRCNQLATICYEISRHKPSYGHRELVMI